MHLEHFEAECDRLAKLADAAPRRSEQRAAVYDRLAALCKEQGLTEMARYWTDAAQYQRDMASRPNQED